MAVSNTFHGTSVQIWLATEIIDQEWDPDADGGAGAWVDDVRITYTRNTAGSTLEQLIDEWDVEEEAWMRSLRISFDRNSEGLTTETLYSEWDIEANDGEGGWVPLQRFQSTYNAQGNTLISTTEFYDASEESYFIYSRSTYTYDASGELVVQRVAESGLFGPLQPSFRYSFTYDDNGNDVEELVENYDSGTGEWENYRFEKRTYDSNGEEIEELIQDWDADADGGQGAWVNSDLTTVLFTPNSADPTQIVETDQVWDPTAEGDGAWVNAERYLTEISASTNTLIETDQRWDVTADGGEGDWVNVDRYTYHYGGAFTTVEFIFEEWDEDQDAWVNVERGTAETNENGLTVVQLLQVWDGMNWINDRRTLFSYEEFASTAVDGEMPGQRFELAGNYPNPFRESTAIEFSLSAPEHVTLEVFDMLGRRVATLIDAVKTTGRHAIVWKAEGMAGGLYVYRLSSDGAQEAATMLLVR